MGSYLSFLRSTEAELDQIGTKLFLLARRVQLTEQMRCQDPDHNKILDDLRQGATTLLKNTDKDEFSTARIISPGNPERLCMSRMLLTDFARKQGLRVVSWHLKM